MNIQGGGRTDNLQGHISEIRPNLNCCGQIELWVTDDKGNESLTYLTMDEAIGLVEELKNTLRKRIYRI